MWSIGEDGIALVKRTQEDVVVDALRGSRRQDVLQGVLI